MHRGVQHIMEWVNQLVEEVLKKLARWAEERPRREKGRILFYCPLVHAGRFSQLQHG
jgi:hypothetical protein